MKHPVMATVDPLPGQVWAAGHSDPEQKEGELVRNVHVRLFLSQYDAWIFAQGYVAGLGARTP